MTHNLLLQDACSIFVQLNNQSVNSEYKKWLQDCETSKEDVQKQFKTWQKKKPKNLDAQFHTGHDRAFSKIDCLNCANCCKTTSPIFRDIDIKRISKSLRLKESEFIRSYLRIDEDKDYVLQKSPCSFLNDDNTCSIYEDRPLACREYPHTDRKNMHQILAITEKNTEICPAVAKITLEIINKS